jgi:hypothetical protein
MPSARKAAMHLAHSLVTICAGTTLLAALAAGCASSAIPHAPVSLAQRQAFPGSTSESSGSRTEVKVSDAQWMFSARRS